MEELKERRRENLARGEWFANATETSKRLDNLETSITEILKIVEPLRKLAEDEAEKQSFWIAYGVIKGRLSKLSATAKKMVYIIGAAILGGVGLISGLFEIFGGK